MSKVKFTESPKYVKMEFNHIGMFDWKVGTSILFGNLQPDYNKCIWFHFNLKCVNGSCKISRGENCLTDGKYPIIYDDLHSFIECEMPEHYMPIFLKAIYNTNEERNKWYLNVLTIWDNPKLLIKTKVRRINKLNWEFWLGSSEKIIANYRRAYDLNNKILAECDELLEILKNENL